MNHIIKKVTSTCPYHPILKRENINAAPKKLNIAPKIIKFIWTLLLIPNYWTVHQKTEHRTKLLLMSKSTEFSLENLANASFQLPILVTKSQLRPSPLVLFIITSSSDESSSEDSYAATICAMIELCHFVKWLQPSTVWDGNERSWKNDLEGSWRTLKDLQSDERYDSFFFEIIWNNFK